ncbi:hypothetical protein BG003_011856 [Podila horticola]|nr:hypothetical protein BG003_011856 [Podila horticola]
MRDSEPEPVLDIGSGNNGWLPDLERRIERGFLRMETGRDEVEVESSDVEADSDLDLGAEGGTGCPEMAPLSSHELTCRESYQS